MYVYYGTTILQQKVILLYQKKIVWQNVQYEYKKTEFKADLKYVE